MGKRLNNKIIDQKLIGRNIKRLNDYMGGHSPINWLCLINTCNYVWKARPTDILNSNKSGCPKCAGNVKLNDKIIDERLENRKIKRLDPYNGIDDLIRFQCLVKDCNYIWKTSPNSVVNCKKSGCPECAGLTKLTNEIIDEKLKGRSIKRLEDCNGSKKPIRFQCLVKDCNYVWKACPGTILTGRKCGCLKCSGNIKFTDEIIDKKLEGRNIKRLNNSNGAKTSINWQCLIEDCGYVWRTTPGSILSGNKTGCPDCAGHVKITDEIIDRKLKDRNIIRLGKCNLIKTPISFQCLVKDCNHIWNATPDSVLNKQKSGCPNCACGKNERLTHEILKLNNIDCLRHYDIRKIIATKRRKIIIDFYIADNNTIIEYNGAQHYRPIRFNGRSIEDAEKSFIKQQERDQYLQQLCDTHNIQLIWIDGRIYTNSKLENHLIETIIPLLK